MARRIQSCTDVGVRLRRLTCLMPLLCCTSGPLLAASADAVFTVGNYPVEASDKNAVAAKDKALADGQKAAFRSLLKRIVPVTAYKQLSRLSGVKAADLVSGVSVRSERNSSTEYIASLDFAFQSDAVKSVLNREGIGFVEVQAQPVTLVTVTLSGNPGEAKNDTSTWHNAWKDLDLEHTLTPVILEGLKPEIHNDTVAMLINGDDNAIRILAGEYKTDRVVFAILEPDPSGKKMQVTLAGQDAVGPFVLKRQYRISDNDFAYACELASVVGLGVLEGRWKAIKAAAVTSVDAGGGDGAAPPWAAGGASGSAGRIPLLIEFSSLAQWNDIRSQLLDTPGVDGLEVNSVSARNADVVLSFPGGPQALANSVGARGLILGEAGSGWVLRSKY